MKATTLIDTTALAPVLDVVPGPWYRGMTPAAPATLARADVATLATTPHGMVLAAARLATATATAARAAEGDRDAAQALLHMWGTLAPVTLPIPAPAPALDLATLGAL